MSRIHLDVYSLARMGSRRIHGQFSGINLIQKSNGASRFISFIVVLPRICHSTNRRNIFYSSLSCVALWSYKNWIKRYAFSSKKYTAYLIYKATFLSFNRFCLEQKRRYSMLRIVEIKLWYGWFESDHNKFNLTCWFKTLYIKLRIRVYKSVKKFNIESEEVYIQVFKL